MNQTQTLFKYLISLETSAFQPSWVKKFQRKHDYGVLKENTGLKLEKTGFGKTEHNMCLKAF